jgi:hypothetical protein
LSFKCGLNKYNLILIFVLDFFYFEVLFVVFVCKFFNLDLVNVDFFVDNGPNYRNDPLVKDLFFSICSFTDPIVSVWNKITYLMRTVLNCL